MYARRNSITLLFILLLISSAGFFWQRREAQALELVADRNKELNLQLRGGLEVAETLVIAQAERDSLQAQWQRSPKKLLNAEEPAFSLSYINWLIQVHNLDLDFDFYLNDKNPQAELTAFSYTLTGEGRYRDIFSLIWYMTHNPLLYQIKSVTFNRSEKDLQTLNFTIMFEGYSMAKDWEISSELTMASPELNWATEFNYDAFNSLVPLAPKPQAVSATPVAARPPQPPPADESPDLLDAEKATLLAITNNKAYLRASDGKVFPLTLGGQVRRGKLTQIDQRNNQVAFELRTESGSKVIRLNIEFN